MQYNTFIVYIRYEETENILITSYLIGLLNLFTLHVYILLDEICEIIKLFCKMSKLYNDFFFLNQQIYCIINSQIDLTDSCGNC